MLRFLAHLEGKNVDDLDWKTRFSIQFGGTTGFLVSLNDLMFAYSGFPNNPDVIIFYLGSTTTTDGHDSLTLFYTPAFQDTNGLYQCEYTPDILSKGGKVVLFDHTLPCPICGLEGGLDGTNVIHPKQSKK